MTTTRRRPEPRPQRRRRTVLLVHGTTPLPLRRVRRLLVAVLTLALVAAAAPALALRFADVTTTGTQPFPGATRTAGSSTSVVPVNTGTWSSSAAVSSGTEGWPWTGSALPAHFTPAAETGNALPPSPVARSFTATCGLISILVEECLNRGTITLSFEHPVTDPLLYVAGLGNQDSVLGVLTTSQSAARLQVASASLRGAAATVTMSALHSVNATDAGPSLQLNGGRLEARATRPGTQCNAVGAGTNLNGRAGCGRVQLTGTFTSVTFTVSLRINAPTLTLGLAPADTFSLYAALPDQPFPSASSLTLTTVSGVAATADLFARGTPGVRANGTTVALDPLSTVLVGSAGWTVAADGLSATSAAGGVALSSAGVATFTPAAGFAGPAQPLAFRISDTAGSTASAVLSLQVTGTRTPLTCGTTLYQLAPSGEIRSVPTSAIGNQASVTSTALLSAVPGTSAANALGVGPAGTTLTYVATRNGATAVVRYDTTSGLYTESVVDTPAARVAGAVNPVTGNFYYGGVATGAAIYMFNPTSGLSYQVGTSPGSGTGNGDYAFTSAGDLHILSDNVVTVVRAADLPSTAGTAALVGTAVSSGASQPGNGIAFGSDGFMYVNNTGDTGISSTLQRVDPVTGALAGTLTTATRATTSSLAAIDLGSCAPTSSIRLEKNVGARVVATDQFALSLATDGAMTLTATTAGTSAGVQSAVAGPRIGQLGRTYTFTETGAGTPAANLASYRPSWRCTNGATGALLTTGTGASGSYTVTAASPLTVVCTFVNDTGPLLQVTKTASSPTFTPGQAASYAVTVTNTGQSATTAGSPIVVSDRLPTGVTLTGVTGAGWSCTGTAALTCSNATVLAAGASTTLTLNVTPTTGAVTGSNTAQVSGGGDLTCPTAGRCTASVAVAIASPSGSGRPLQCNAPWGVAAGATTTTPAGNQLYSLDPVTGAAARVATDGVAPSGNVTALAIDPRTGRMFAVENLPATGGPTLRTLPPGSTTWVTTTATVPGASGANAVTRAVMDGSGFLYLGRHAATNTSIYRYPVALDGTVGSPTTIAVSGLSTTAFGGGDFAIAPDGTFYFAAPDAGQIGLFRIVPAAGTMASTASAAAVPVTTSPQTVPGVTDLAGLAFTGSTLLGATNESALFRFNLTAPGPSGTWPGTGGTTAIGPAGAPLSDLASCQGAATFRLAKNSTNGTGTFAFTGLTNVANNVGTPVTTDTITTTTAGTSVLSPATHIATQLGTAITATETVPTGWSVSAASGICTDANTATTGNPATFGSVTAAGAVTVPATNVRPGAAIICTVTNTQPPVLATTKALTLVNGSAAVVGQNVVPGDVLTYTVTVANTGAGAGSTVVTETVPVGTTFTGTAPLGWSCATGAVAGATCAQTFAVPAASSTSRTFVVTVGSTAGIATPPTSIVNTVATSVGACATCTVTTALAPLVPVVKTVATQGRPAQPAGAVVGYTLTFTNAGAARGYLDHEDVLTGVLDDAVWPNGAGGALVQPTVTPSGSVTAVFSAGTQRIAIAGTIPAGQTVTVTYAVQVKEWATIVAGSTDAVLRNAVVRPGATPPATCAAGSTTCTTTPLASYALTKTGTPAPTTQVDPGATVTASVAVVSHPRSTGAVNDVQIVDNLTEVLDDAAFVPGSAVLTVSGTATALPGLAPAFSAVTQQWTLTSPAFVLPATATATLTYAVVVDQGAWFSQLRNVAGVTGGIAPESCPVVTGPQGPIGVVAPACQTIHQVSGLIELQKVGLDGAGATVPMAGSTFAIHSVTAGPGGASLGPVEAAVAPVAVPGQVGRFTVPRIPIGTHYLVETAAPDGYSLLAQPVLVEVTAGRTVVVAAAEAPTVTTTNPAAPAFPLVTVRDVPRFAIPEAGGTGSAPFRGLGLGLVGAAVALLGLLDLRRRAGSATLRTEGRAAAPPG